MHSAKSIIAVAMAMAPATLAATGGFFGYCTSNSLDYSTIISNCQGGVTASYDLNNALADRGGNLVWAENGEFYAACGPNAGGHCSLDYATLICDCNTPNGGPISTSINLNDHLFYDTDREVLYLNGV